YHHPTTLFIFTLSLHDALPISLAIFDLIDKLGVAVFPSHPFGCLLSAFLAALFASFRVRAALQPEILALHHQLGVLQRSVKPGRSEEHTSELQSLTNLVCRLLL